ncbi:MAG TPA: sialate O-acetylesterase [Lacipirellulaceae bacterium]|nr:sialate O-acetylesterase [Lacipirellulaceae bacterium]
MFTDHAVLQRDMPVPVWGWADPGEEVKVSIAGQTEKATADDKGNWRVTLKPLSVGEPLTLVVEGKNKLEVKDLLVGEVWLCSGQSNMEFALTNAQDGDLEIAAANHPQIRLVRVKELGSQEPLHDFEGEWNVCDPSSAAPFSAVGYFFGRELQEQLNVPIGLIDDSWGGSACEAWIRRDRMEGNPEYEGLLKKWDDTVKNFDETKWKAEQAERQKKIEEARTTGKRGKLKRPQAVEPAQGQNRPANLYHARLEPVMPYAVRGVIWYQGETNAGRAYQYRDMFPLMIKSWREDWKEGDFPFYWVQLADFMPEKPEPSNSAWAELREAQTMTMDKLPHTGQAVIIDIGDAADIHPRRKEEVGKRLARWALAKDYGKQIAYESPQYESMEKKGDKIVLKFKNVGEGLKAIDYKEVKGFAIAGEDKKFHWAEAKIVKPNEIEVSSKDVTEPVAVRYAWADNPVCNVYEVKSLLPLTPFRTDDWDGVTKDALQ